MGQLESDANPAARAKAFLCEYVEAPNDADIEFREAMTGDGEPSMVISINGSMHGFTAAEARVVAKIAETMMREFPKAKEADGLDNLIVSLRACADKVDAN